MSADSFPMFKRCSIRQWRGMRPVMRRVAVECWKDGSLPTIDSGMQILTPIWIVERPVGRALYLMSMKDDGIVA